MAKEHAVQLDQRDLDLVIQKLEVIEKRLDEGDEYRARVNKNVNAIRLELNQILSTSTRNLKSVKDKAGDDELNSIRNKPENTYTKKEIAEILINAGIMEKNQEDKNSSFLTVLEHQVKLCGNKTLMTVVSNVSARISQGGVKNKLGYFRTSMNEAVGR